MCSKLTSSFTKNSNVHQISQNTGYIKPRKDTLFTERARVKEHANNTKEVFKTLIQSKTGVDVSDKKTIAIHRIPEIKGLSTTTICEIQKLTEISNDTISPAMEKKTKKKLHLSDDVTIRTPSPSFPQTPE